MPKKNESETYKEIAIKSAGKLKSLLLLVNRAILLLKEAKEDKEKTRENIIKTQNILAQLEKALNFKEGDLAGDLFFIYDYLFAELNNMDDKAIDTSIKMLTDLKETFTAIQKRL